MPKTTRYENKVIVVMDDLPAWEQNAGRAQTEAAKVLDEKSEKAGAAKRVTRGFTVWEVNVAKK